MRLLYRPGVGRIIGLMNALVGRCVGTGYDNDLIHVASRAWPAGLEGERGKGKSAEESEIRELVRAGTSGMLWMCVEPAENISSQSRARIDSSK